MKQGNGSSFCGADCASCQYGRDRGCAGCRASDGCPCGTSCFIAQYIKVGGNAAYERFLDTLKEEIRQLGIPGLPAIAELFPMNGAFLNIAYPLPNGDAVKFLNDDGIYLAAQAESEFNDGSVVRCFGVACNADFILVSEYGPNGSDPVLVAYKKR